MDRFEWSDGKLKEGETVIKQQGGVKISDGPEKVLTCDFSFNIIVFNKARKKSGPMFTTYLHNALVPRKGYSPCQRSEMKKNAWIFSLVS